MMQLPGFASVLQRCHTALAPYGVNLYNEIAGLHQERLTKASNIIQICVAVIQVSYSSCFSYFHNRKI